VWNPNFLFHSARSQVKSLTEFAKKPEHFQPMLRTVLTRPPKGITSMAVAVDRRMHAIEEEGKEHGQ